MDLMDLNRPHSTRASWLLLFGIVLSALLIGLYARGGHAWPLGFVMLVPWLLALNRAPTVGHALLSSGLMSVGFVLAVFAWFGSAIGAYTGIGTLPALLLLCLLAPLLQPQILAYALIRHLLRRRFGALFGALGGAAAWVGCEWLWPKLLGDTLGHGLLPSATLRQMADLGGAASLTVLLILSCEALTVALSRWHGGRRNTRALYPPLLLAALLPALMAGYGQLRLSQLFGAAVDAAPVATLRVGLVQSAIIDYDRMRAEIGAYAVVRQVLDTHFGMSRAAIEQQGAEVLLWSETVYPTTFGQPQSTDGAALDQEILDFVQAHGTPLVFGSYDRDAGGEYNAAAFVLPDQGLIGFYRKTYPFPLTEHVPGWLDSALLRRWLPWTGHWQPGNGARVLPLRSAAGHELNVLPLICLDAVAPQLAIDGARLGAQAIISLSNDAWFSAQPLGAQLHLSVAAFRSIETRLPQLRVTSNGHSAIIDPTGEVVVSTKMGDQAILVGELPIQDPPSTLMVRWGDWVGPTALVFLLLLLVVWGIAGGRDRQAASDVGAAPLAGSESANFSADVAVLSPFWRFSSGLLRVLAGAGLLWLGLKMLWGDGLQVNSLLQLQLFAWTVVLPALAAWFIQRSFAARASVEPDHVLLITPRRRIEIPLAQLAQLHVWRCPLPASGLSLQFVSGRRWPFGIVMRDPLALYRAIRASNASVSMADPKAQRMAEHAALCASARHRWLDHALLKFVLFPLLPALPAFRLHQHIAFGGSFGEYYTYGLGAWLSGLLIWWAAWAIGLMLFAAVLRLIIESSTLLSMSVCRPYAALIRRTLEWSGRLAYYLGIPIWLIVRIASW
jgi:apolipoprotein N-acyltransferase